MGNQLSGTDQSGELTVQCNLRCTNNPKLTPPPDKIDTHTQLIVSVVQLLVQNLAENNSKVVKALSTVQSYTDLLFVAAANGYNDLIPMLVKLGADLNAVDADWRSVIYAAVRADTIMLLLKLGCTKDIRGYYNGNVMHHAILRKHKDLVLAIHQFDPELINGVDRYGDTPMHDAARNKDPSMVKLLGRCSSQPLYSVNKEGMTPLHVAVIMRNVNTVAALIELGSDLDKQTSSMSAATALHFVMASYYYESTKLIQIVELLLINGTKAIRIKNNAGKTPIFMRNAYLDNFVAVELIVRFDSSVLDSVDERGDNPLVSYVRSQNDTHTKTPALISMISLFGGVAEYRRLCTIYGATPVSVSEDELAEVRYRTYFSCSLVYYLLCVGQRHKS
jgi:hypothetical protein